MIKYLIIPTDKKKKKKRTKSRATTLVTGLKFEIHQQHLLIYCRIVPNTTGLHLKNITGVKPLKTALVLLKLSV